MITDENIITLYNNCTHIHNKHSYAKNHLFSNDEINFINNRFSDSKSFNESLDRILNGLIIRPKCKYCEKEVQYVGKKNLLFRTYCSNECKYNDTNLVERHKLGCLNKYGVDNISKLDEIKEKKKKTHLLHYGTINNFGLDSVKQKIIEKYGVDNISKLDEIKEKKKKTCLEKYNVETYLQHPIAREKRKSIKSLEKEYNTKKKNNSFAKSNTEDNSYLLIKEKYLDVIRQYRSKEYPFNCDFYIPSLNLYIECNYHWTHGNKPYEGTIEDINKINIWKLKNTKYYNNAIDIWTIRDVNKRIIAKENNLNYLEFWNINELKIWLNN